MKFKSRAIITRRRSPASDWSGHAYVMAAQQRSEIHGPLRWKGCDEDESRFCCYFAYWDESRRTVYDACQVLRDVRIKSSFACVISRQQRERVLSHIPRVVSRRVIDSGRSVKIYPSSALLPRPPPPRGHPRDESEILKSPPRLKSRPSDDNLRRPATREDATCAEHLAAEVRTYDNVSVRFVFFLLQCRWISTRSESTSYFNACW